MFEKFLEAFPREPGKPTFEDGNLLANEIEEQLGCDVPQEIKDFWRQVGSGYFGDRVLYFFGNKDMGAPRDSLVDWNKKDFWRNIYPIARDGGPVFFAETCFGDQLGFRWDKNGELVYVLFSVDTFDAFSVARGEGKLFSQILIDRYALLDEARYDGVRAVLGIQEAGMHYAPLVSPMLGGKGTTENFCLETPNVHFRTAVAAFLAKRS